MMTQKIKKIIIAGVLFLPFFSFAYTGNEALINSVKISGDDLIINWTQKEIFDAEPCVVEISWDYQGFFSPYQPESDCSTTGEKQAIISDYVSFLQTQGQTYYFASISGCCEAPILSPFFRFWVSPVIQTSASSTAEILSPVGILFSDFWVLIAVIVGIPLLFWIFGVIINIFPNNRD